MDVDGVVHMKFRAPPRPPLCPCVCAVVVPLVQVLDPAERLTAREVMSHPWMRSASPAPLMGGVTDRLRKLTGKQRCV